MNGLALQIVQHGFSEREAYISDQKVVNAKRIADAERSLPSSPVKYVSSEAFTPEFERQKKRLVNSSRGNPKLQVYCIRNAHSCLTPVSSLTKIHLEDMHVRKHHQGHYLLCRTIEKANRARGVAISLAVEDTKGWTQSVAIYNFPGTQNAPQYTLDAIFPVHSIILIREPFCKVDLLGDTDQSLIEIHSPTDLVVLEEDDKLLDGVEWKTGTQPYPGGIFGPVQWRKAGDKNFLAKQYFAAAVAYSNALRQDDSSTAYRLARSVAYNHLGAYNVALQDCQSALANPTISEADRRKAIAQSARAAYGNRDYETSMRLYLDWQALDGNDRIAKMGSQKCIRRIKEHKKAEYDWKSLYQEVVGGNVDLDVAEFRGPVRVGDAPEYGGGRGVMATRDIAPGELLVVAKPFASFCKNDSEGFFRIVNVEGASLKTDIDDSLRHMAVVLHTEMHYSLLQKAVIKSLFQQQSPGFDDLYAGDQFPPLGSTKARNIPSHSLEFITDISVERIEKIMSLNAFGFREFIEVASDTAQAAVEGGKSNGLNNNSIDSLYLLPSYFNHSCAPSSNRANFGDVMIIRAVKKIRIGEQVTVSYYGTGSTYETRSQLLSQWFRKCNCSLCEADRATDPEKRQKRPGLLLQLRDPASPGQKLALLARRLDRTYPDSYGLFRWEAYEGHFWVLNRLQDDSEIIQECMKALEALGVRVLDQNAAGMSPSRFPISTDFVPYHSMKAVDLCLIIAIKLESGSPLQAYKWLDAAIWIENGKNGGGAALFGLKYAEILEITRLKERVAGMRL